MGTRVSEVTWVTWVSRRRGGCVSLLASIKSPADVKRLAPEELPRLAEEIRTFLVDAVCRTGGHLGPNLGTVELTLAIHRVFDSPHDVVLWDTGHQSYVHKLLTGRQDQFPDLRQYKGLSGYPSRAESEHDHVENSHASTALSYADGLSRAFRLNGETDRHLVVVVGDGALTGGMCWVRSTTSRRMTTGRSSSSSTTTAGRTHRRSAAWPNTSPPSACNPATTGRWTQ